MYPSNRVFHKLEIGNNAMNLWFQVQKFTFLINSGSLYIHALLILTESSGCKNQEVPEQKFKDLPSSTCQVSVEGEYWAWNQRFIRD